MRKTQHFLPVDTNYINQQNPEERSSQIQFMKTILEQNAAVYAWLGLPTEDTSMAFEKLEEFSKVVAGRLFHQFLVRWWRRQGPLLGVRDQTAFEAARLSLSSVIEIQEGRCLTEAFILWGERVFHPPF